MHFSLILLAIGVACGMRLVAFRPRLGWSTRWRHTLGLFLGPPLLLLITAGAVLGMGRQGQMLGLPAGEIGYICALGFLALALGCLVWRAGQAWHSFRQLRHYPAIEIEQTPAYLLDSAVPFAAQIGVWQPRLVVSQGLFTQLTADQIQAVIAHEQAHTHYRDTFWFFWLGWLRHLTAWLPNTEALWQELLLLREVRADRWAAQQVDPLLVAEALLQMAQAPLIGLEPALEHSCAAISAGTSLSRLEERIEALLSEETLPESASLPWLWLLLSLIPLLTMVLHR
ncbi:M56 family metallopeptidase [Leptolyngbya sp. NK1-12]|uniref:M56 family metallopeptidase n=1 Tax=Leptolyngbya sp. NK1-12 TaxID=2547451 RepID=A0AA97AK35_9CYAN|nr:M56 family metallopeptidase [Leptolyngbya sp. NK1-12]WNZ23282.1 M56 family metallopeptidase [Leptolyngbya sp. NK1-12]